MLSAGCRDLATRDTAIPGLRTVLDVEAFAAALRPHLPDLDHGKIRLSKVRYRPSLECLVTYSVKAGGERLEIHAKAHGDSLLYKLRKERERKNFPGPFGLGRIVLEDAGILVTVFPNDGKLKTLEKIVETEARRKLLENLFPGRPDLWDGAVRALAYKPERRYVARLDAPGGSPQAVLKFYKPRPFAAALKNAGVFRSKGRLRVPRCLNFSEPDGVLAFEWLKGKALNEIIADDPGLALPSVRNAGEALAEMHSQDAGGLSPRGMDAEAAALFAMAEKIGFLCPSLSGQAEVLAEKLAAWLAARPPVHRPVHGDFFAKQVLVADGRTGIVDFDEVFLGDPGADLGRFIAISIPEGCGAPLKDALLAGYESVAGEVPSGLQAFTALGLFRLAHHPFRRGEADWPEKMKAMLERAEAMARTSDSKRFYAHTL